MMKWALLAAVMIFGVGCAGMNPQLSGMTPAQIRESARIKNAGVECFAGTYAGARVNLLNIDADKGVPVNVTIDSDCKATFSGVDPSPKLMIVPPASSTPGVLSNSK